MNKATPSRSAHPGKENLARLAVKIEVGSLVGIVQRSGPNIEWDLKGISEVHAGQIRAITEAKEEVFRKRSEICLPLCESLVALIAPKGRIDDFLGNHHEELQALVRNLGPLRGAWICRLRLAGTIVRMLPTIGLRLFRLAVLWHMSKLGL